MNKNKYAVGLGRLGGNKTHRLHGTDHFKTMAHKAWERRRKREEVLQALRIADLDNPVTLQSLREKLEQIDSE